jgi:Berberine and berberine like
MWGSPYDRLYKIKTQVDPKGIFWSSPGVGADDFKIVDGRLCKAQSKGKAEDAAPAIDNHNYKKAAGSAYKTFPESQEAADKEATLPFGQ